MRIAAEKAFADEQGHEIQLGCKSGETVFDLRFLFPQRSRTSAKDGCGGEFPRPLTGEPARTNPRSWSSRVQHDERGIGKIFMGHRKWLPPQNDLKTAIGARADLDAKGH